MSESENVSENVSAQLQEGREEAPASVQPVRCQEGRGGMLPPVIYILFHFIFRVLHLTCVKSSSSSCKINKFLKLMIKERLIL